GKPEDGCTTTGNDPDHCGGCARICSSNHTASRMCTASSCTPTCTAPYADCNRPVAPSADDGCETNTTLDPGEPDNGCPAAVQSVDEGNTGIVSNHRILPSGDTDTFTFHLVEGSHFCFPGDGQSYQAKVVLAAPESTALKLNYNLSSCNNTWQS